MQAVSSEGVPTVLVVEDEAFIRMLLVDILEDAGCRVIEAADSTSGQLHLDCEAVIDLMITDVSLPGGKSGTELVAIARQARPELKVLFVTGYPDSKILPGGRPDAATRLLGKPFVVEALVAEVEQLLGDRLVRMTAAS